jgi:hypothetical protein
LYLLIIKQVECEQEIGINKASTSKNITSACCQTPQMGRLFAKTMTQKCVQFVPLLMRTLVADFTMIELNKSTIDLVRTYEAYEKNMGVNKKWNHSFGFSVVNLALGVVTGWPRQDDLVGIRKCLAYEIGCLKKKEYLWIFPMGATNLGDDIKIHKNEMLIVDSLIFSIIEFSDHLHGAGMSGLVRTKLRRGFELICLWACSIDLLNPDKNDWIIVRENEKWEKYISNEHERQYGRNE